MIGASTADSCVCVQAAAEREGGGQPAEIESQDGGVCVRTHTVGRAEPHTTLTLTAHYFASSSVNQPPTFASRLLVHSGWS